MGRFHYLHHASETFPTSEKRMRVRVMVENDHREASVYLCHAKGPDLLAWFTVIPEGVELARQVGNKDCPAGILADWIDENPRGNRVELAETAAMWLRKIAA